jgi:hypothetical protein
VTTGQVGTARVVAIVIALDYHVNLCGYSGTPCTLGPFVSVC